MKQLPSEGWTNEPVELTMAEVRKRIGCSASDFLDCFDFLALGSGETEKEHLCRLEHMCTKGEQFKLIINKATDKSGRIVHWWWNKGWTAGEGGWCISLTEWWNRPSWATGLDVCHHRDISGRVAEIPALIPLLEGLNRLAKEIFLQKEEE